MTSVEILQEISQLSYNWNGYDAEKIPQSVIEKALQILDSIVIQPEIFPTARRSIQFEYDNDHNDYLEFEIFEDAVDAFMLKENGEKRGYTLSDMDEINDIVAAFLFIEKEGSI